MECRIVILNYNGRELLPKCLPSIVEAARSAEHPTRITVLDNRSPDDDLSYVRQNFPDVEVVIAPQNLYLCSYNDYLRQMKEPVAILLNNDIRVDRGFIDPLIETFVRNPQTFLAAPCVRSFDGKTVEAGRSKAGIKFGMFWCEARYSGYEKETQTPSETYTSGFGAFSREKFLELGGYDILYLPGIMEDVDICYRAQQAGYRLYYEPQSVVYHMGQASFKNKFGSYGIAVMAHRNNFLFMWKNFKRASFWLPHIFFLPMRLVYSLVAGNFAFVAGFWRAVRKPKYLRGRE
jgi:GT2 family glycosyltransferase